MQLAFSTKEFRESEACEKPDGGFFRIKGEELLLLVFLVQRKLLSTVALRVYLALAELRGERFVHFLVLRNEAREWNKSKEGIPPKPFRARYAIVPELVSRTGLPAEKLRPALSELERLDLVTVSP